MYFCKQNVYKNKTAVVQILPLNRQGNVGIFEAMSELFRTIYLDIDTPMA
jgi:hypothetical protein